jgi:hypothetical protein
MASFHGVTTLMVGARCRGKQALDALFPLG